MAVEWSGNAPMPRRKPGRFRFCVCADICNAWSPKPFLPHAVLSYWTTLQDNIRRVDRLTVIICLSALRSPLADINSPLSVKLRGGGGCCLLVSLYIPHVSPLRYCCHGSRKQALFAGAIWLVNLSNTSLIEGSNNSLLRECWVNDFPGFSATHTLFDSFHPWYCICPLSNWLNVASTSIYESSQRSSKSI